MFFPEPDEMPKGCSGNCASWVFLRLDSLCMDGPHQPPAVVPGGDLDDSDKMIVILSGCLGERDDRIPMKCRKDIREI